MKKHGFMDEQTKKVEEEKKGQWGGATIKDLQLVTPVTVPTSVCD